ncbi:interleukin-17C precursor [Oryzias latipes]|uniref:Interleukin-17C n=1 Tax=Oryzias latipes TaxID=8090 RepID=E3WEB0_ORYLA|nr:interleukin-17C precursor [Oryzias latipes]BAJ41374.1 interleukin-17C [Oryzias latipes]
MRLNQILIGTVCLVALCACKKCVSVDDLKKIEEKAMRKHGIGIWQHSISSPSSDATGCPVDLYQNWDSKDEKRSVSPWKYTEVTREGYFPPSYMEAQCLCKGCILKEGNNVIESHNFNSKPLVVSRMFLRRVLCEGGNNGTAKTYKLERVQLDVAVGCICVRTRS